VLHTERGKKEKNMKKVGKILVTFALSAVFAVCAGCSKEQPPVVPPAGPKPMLVPSEPPAFTPHKSAAGIPDRLTLENEASADFSKGAPEGFYWADGYSNGDPFNCTWRKSSAIVGNGAMSMSVVREGNGYAGAEYRTDKTYSYGFYSVCMKAANCSGVISSFFTYTNKPVWDEIDIEFLGKDMSHIQFNYYKGGVGGHEYYFDLGFNASADFHEYAFDWQPDCIVWYVDGKAVYRVTENLPSHPMQIMMNVWNCKGADGWSGAFDSAALPATAEYRWFAYVPND